jgi:DNA-binding transcriptional regulator YiaG
MPDVAMSATEAFYILQSLETAPDRFAEMVGHQSHTTLVYRMHRSRVTPLLARLLRAAYHHPEAGYLALVEAQGRPIEFPAEAPLRRFAPGRHPGEKSRFITAEAEGTPIQRELRHIFAALEMSQSDAADALGLTRSAVSLWFAKRRSATPLTAALRILRAALHTDLLAHMASTTPVVPPADFTPPLPPRPVISKSEAHAA